MPTDKVQVIDADTALQNPYVVMHSARITGLKWM